MFAFILNTNSIWLDHLPSEASSFPLSEFEMSENNSLKCKHEQQTHDYTQLKCLLLLSVIRYYFKNLATHKRLFIFL